MFLYHISLALVISLNLFMIIEYSEQEDLEINIQSITRGSIIAPSVLQVFAFATGFGTYLMEHGPRILALGI